MKRIFCKKHSKNEIELISTERSADSPLLCKQCLLEKQNSLDNSKLFKIDEYHRILLAKSEDILKIPLKNAPVPKEILEMLDKEKTLVNDFCAYIEAEKSKIQIKYSSLFVEISHLMDKKKKECLLLLDHQKNILKEAFSSLRAKVDVCYQADISAYKQELTDNFSRVKDYKELNEFILNKNVIFREMEDLLNIINEEALEEYRSGLTAYTHDVGLLAKQRPVANLIVNSDQSVKNFKEHFEALFAEFNLIKPMLENLRIQNYVFLEHLITPQDFSWLTSYIRPDSQLKIALLYKGSREKFSSKVFREKCGEISPLLFVAKSNFGKIFGAYTEEKWSKEICQGETLIKSQNHLKNPIRNHIYTKGNKTFLFSSTNRGIFPLKTTTKGAEYYNPVAIQDNLQDGPIFGIGDLYIPDKADSSKCSSCLGCSFSADSIANQSENRVTGFVTNKNEAMSQLGGDIFFTLEELDIYHIQ